MLSEVGQVLVAGDYPYMCS